MAPHLVVVLPIILSYSEAIRALTQASVHGLGNAGITADVP